MTDTATTATKSSRVASVRASFYKARAALGERGNLFTLILSSLFLMVVAFAVYFAADLVSFGLDALTPLSDTLCNAVFYAALALGAAFALLPMALGWLRLAALMAKGETPFARGMLYYMEAPRRYGRAVLLGVLCAVAVGLPLALAAAPFAVASLFANEIQAGTLAADVATRQVAVLYALASILALPALALEGFALPVVAEGIKDEKRTPFAALLRGWRLGARHFGANWLCLWSVMWRTALSACTLGILWLTWHGPLSAVAYLCYIDSVE